jgi:predicted dienelactone hydrolase
MRILEIIVLVLLMIMLIWVFKRNAAKSRPFAILSACAFLIIIMHLFIDGWRWQMVPAYGVGAVMLIIAGRWFLKRQTESKPPTKMRRALRIILSSTGILLLLVSGFLSWALPVFQLPAPTGPCRIGVSQWFLTDVSREETLTADPGDHRELTVCAWYPADASGLTKTAGYLNNPQIVGRALAGTLPGAGFLFSHLRLVRTHSFPNAPVSNRESSYPVLIYSHGYGQHAGLNTALMEELASYGYIVFSIGHTYESTVEVFPDGRQARFIQTPNSIDGKTYQKLSKEAEELKPNDLAARVMFFRRFQKLTTMESTRIYVWSADTRFVIDWLDKINNEDTRNPFYRRLDLKKLGVFGMSFGGAAAGQLCVEDRRVKAAINMDGFPYGDLIDHPLEIPFMFMRSQWSSTQFNGIFQSIIDFTLGSSRSAAYDVFVKESAHVNYTDLSVWSPVLKYTGLFGKIDGARMMKIMNAYVPAFFNKHLKGIDSPLLDGLSPDFPEVIFKARKQ